MKGILRGSDDIPTDEIARTIESDFTASLRANPMPTSPEHQPEDQSLLDTDILSAPGESIYPLVIRNASAQSALASNCGRLRERAVAGLGGRGVPVCLLAVGITVACRVCKPP
jgi:hypothetical protein